eukprot:2339854-Alexandrium_andersonii.AAC.1
MSAGDTELDELSAEEDLRPSQSGENFGIRDACHLPDNKDTRAPTIPRFYNMGVGKGAKHVGHHDIDARTPLCSPVVANPTCGQNKAGSSKGSAPTTFGNSWWRKPVDCHFHLRSSTPVAGFGSSSSTPECVFDYDGGDNAESSQATPRQGPQRHYCNHGAS